MYFNAINSFKVYFGKVIFKLVGFERVLSARYQYVNDLQPCVVYLYIVMHENNTTLGGSG